MGNHPGIQEYLDTVAGSFSLEEIMDMNDLSEEEVFRILWEGGFILFPPYDDCTNDKEFT